MIYVKNRSVGDSFNGFILFFLFFNAISVSLRLRMQSIFNSVTRAYK